MGSITIKADVFELYKRATHVFSEARRVFQFKDTCENPAPGNLLKVRYFEWPKMEIANADNL